MSIPCEMATKFLVTEDGDPDGPYDCGEPAVCRFGHTEEDAFPVCAKDREYCLTDSDMGREFPLLPAPKDTP